MGHRLTAISTRTGDAGTTGLGDGSRCSKSAARIQALGDVDELNSHLGLLRSLGLPEAIDNLLLQVQHDLFDLGGELSVPGMTLLKPEQVAALDEALKAYNAQLPPLAEFILPGGTQTASQAHVCRTVARRAERSVVAVADEVAPSGGAETPPLLRPELLQYLNRLSDLMFVLARTLNRAGEAASTEIYWKHQRQPRA
ncbi:cob(I)yrinic acid a,c-diamide adenosyltransferase [Thiomonas bhubaneswarensis]|uniref:Cobalamin adenosyltransferase n=1 Tax=Thiomonas bhubaneswarensis TaxID=339866 RepID=A0A0K6HTW2_9BURK|nr:cob(I)yrinic acid a,c-diamide adenosyltransferase [Thiomonas bhubaneswarensis]CUA94276.1 ATP:cob(I)alamin adenosyltransferase [Thiomonas bhubaneswarensis]